MKKIIYIFLISFNTLYSQCIEVFEVSNDQCITNTLGSTIEGFQNMSDWRIRYDVTDTITIDSITIVHEVISSNFKQFRIFDNLNNLLYSSNGLLMPNGIHTQTFVFSPSATLVSGTYFMRISSGLGNSNYIYSARSNACYYYVDSNQISVNKEPIMRIYFN